MTRSSMRARFEPMTAIPTTPIWAWATPVGALFAMFLLFLGTGPVNTLILETVPANLRASAMAISIFLIHLCGDMWSSEIVGHLSDRPYPVVRPFDSPVIPRGSYAVIYGNVAPQGAVIKLAGHNIAHFEGPARVFESQDAAVKAIGDAVQSSVANGPVISIAVPVMPGVNAARSTLGPPSFRLPDYSGGGDARATNTP